MDIFWNNAFCFLELIYLCGVKICVFSKALSKLKYFENFRIFKLKHIDFYMMAETRLINDQPSNESLMGLAFDLHNTTKIFCNGKHVLQLAFNVRFPLFN